MALENKDYIIYVVSVCIILIGIFIVGFGAYGISKVVHAHEFCKSKNLTVLDHNNVLNLNLKVTCSDNIMYEGVLCRNAYNCLEYNKYQECSKHNLIRVCEGSILK